MTDQDATLSISEHSSFPFRTIELLAIFVCGCLWLTSAAQAETTKSLEEFNAQRSEWASLVGATLQIEGRYSILSTSQLRMVKCDLEFVLAKDFPKPASDSKTIQIKGRLEKRDGKLVFVVSEMQPQVSDVDRFRSLRGKVPSSKAEEWYKLAEWGANRATFYRDDDLRKESELAFKQGVQAEHRNLKRATPAALRELAQKLSSAKIDPALQQEFFHEAFRTEWNTIRKENRGGDGELLTEMAKQLPGTDQPLTPEDDAARVLYLNSPLVVFKDGDADQRQKYARVFYIEVLKERILRDASPDGKNGYEIAFRIEKQLPEYASLGSEYREQERKYHLERVGSMTRKEMTDLVARYEPLDVPEFLLELKQRWVAEKELLLDPLSAIALVDIGDDYLIILNDRDAAIRSYLKADAVSPGTQAISAWLTQQGLVNHRGSWIPKESVPPPVEDPIAAAVREGQVREGMTAEQVKSSLVVEPTRRTRIATSSHIQEWWLYEDHGLSIQFTRRRRPEVAVVTKVMTLSAKPRPTQSEPANPIGSEGF